MPDVAWLRLHSSCSWLRLLFPQVSTQRRRWPSPCRALRLRKGPGLRSSRSSGCSALWPPRGLGSSHVRPAAARRRGGGAAARRRGSGGSATARRRCSGGSTCGAGPATARRRGSSGGACGPGAQPATRAQHAPNLPHACVCFACLNLSLCVERPRVQGLGRVHKEGP